MGIVRPLERPQSAEAYNLNNVCNAVLTSANRSTACPRTFTVTHKQSITDRMIPQDILSVKLNILYIVFNWKFLEQNHKIYLYVYNTALIRVMGCFAISVRINAVLFPLYWSWLTANTHFIRLLYAYSESVLYANCTHSLDKPLVMVIRL